MHELLIALIALQSDFELLDDSDTSFSMGFKENEETLDPASLIKRNKRILRSYQSLIRSAVTLDGLMDSENGGKSKL